MTDPVYNLVAYASAVFVYKELKLSVCALQAIHCRSPGVNETCLFYPIWILLLFFPYPWLAFWQFSLFNSAVHCAQGRWELSTFQSQGSAVCRESRESAAERAISVRHNSPHLVKETEVMCVCSGQGTSSKSKLLWVTDCGKPLHFSQMKVGMREIVRLRTCWAGTPHMICCTAEGDLFCYEFSLLERKKMGSWCSFDTLLIYAARETKPNQSFLHALTWIKIMS